MSREPSPKPEPSRRAEATPGRRSRLARLNRAGEAPITPKQGVIGGLAMIGAGVAFWFAVAVFPAVDWNRFDRIAFLFVILPVFGIIFIVTGAVRAIRARLDSRHKTT